MANSMISGIKPPEAYGVYHSPYDANYDQLRKLKEQMDMVGLGQVAIQAAAATPVNTTSNFEVTKVENGFLLKARVGNTGWRQYIAKDADELRDLFITAMVADKLD
jgi:hypothetical protein